MVDHALRVTQVRTDIQAERSVRRRWLSLMDTDIGIIPLPIYLVLVALVITFTITGHIGGEISMVIGVMSVFAFTLGEIGRQLPLVRNIGAGAILVTFVPSFLTYKGWIPAQAVQVVGDFFRATNILSLFIAAVIVGSILSMDRSILIRGFVKIFVPLAAGSLVAAMVGTAIGAALGLGAFDTFFYIVAPIMAGGVGEGAIPLSIGYATATGTAQGDILARVLPAVLVGNLSAIVLAGLLDHLGRRRPYLTGQGRLLPGSNDDYSDPLDAVEPDGNVQNIAAAAMTAVTLYLCGVLAFQSLGFPAPVVMLVGAVVLKLAHGVSPRLQAGSYTVYRFCLTAIAYPMLFAFGVVLTPWDKLLLGFKPANLVTVVATVASLVATGFGTAPLVGLYPVESATVTATHSGMGGAGDIAILAAGRRMQLMPFAQIATRIGGGIMVAIALAAMAAFGR